MQQDAQEMLRYFLTNLHETLLEALSSLPPRPEAPTSPTMQEGLGKDAINVAASLGKLATRKRKLPQERKDRCKVSKTLRRKSASSTKVTDYFHSATSVEDEEAVALAVRDHKPRLSMNEDLDFVKDIFQGELISQTRCYECDSHSRRTEAFLDVSLAVSSPGFPGFPVDDSAIATPHSSSSRTLAREMSFVGPFSLSRVLSQFCLREKLRGDNKYHCEGCGHLAEAERSVMFGRLPLVMTLHLNRFATHSMHWTSSGSLAVNKIGGNVAVPLATQFTAWCTEDCIRRDELYHLIAVVFHTGSSCSTGHYTACVRGKECRVSSSPADWIRADTDWVEFDDELVTLISQEELMDRLSPLTPTTAYILFYSVGGV